MQILTLPGKVSYVAKGRDINYVWYACLHHKDKSPHNRSKNLFVQEKFTSEKK